MTQRYDSLARVGEPLGPNTPEGLAQAWLAWKLDVQGRSQRTFDSYGIILRQWITWADDNGVDPLTPTIDELERWVQRPRIRQAKGKMGSPATRRGDVVCVRGWFEWLHRRGHVPVDPTVDLQAPTVKAGLPKPIPDGDWRVLIEADMTPRLRLAMGLGYYCGLRREEIVSLTGAQVSPTHIHRFVRKGGAEDSLPWRSLVGVYEDHLPQLIPEPEWFVDGLLEHAQDVGRHRMFWTEGQAMYKYMARVCRRVDVGPYTPHQLRHSCATNLIRAGVRIELVASMLNHSSLDITRRYIRAGGDELDEWRRMRNRTARPAGRDADSYESAGNMTT